MKTKYLHSKASWRLPLAVALFASSGSVVSLAQTITPPNMAVCTGTDCKELPKTTCSNAGFAISLKSYIPASTQSSGVASYVYEVCSPPSGTCSGTLRPGEPCLDNSFCQRKGQNTDSTALCSRDCAVDTFRGLSHFDATFPNLATSTCLTAQTDVSGSCSAVDKNNDGVFPVVGAFTLGDSSCFQGTDSSGTVAKCDGTSIEPGDCIEMTLNIAGETTGLGLGTAVVVDKEATTCTSSCLAGPSCEPCDKEQGSNHCLTRTIGFWGTHPWIANNYATAEKPVTVCGYPLNCRGADDGKSSPACLAGSCDSVMEGLGSNPGGELKTNPSYVSMIKQLTAVKLNIAATTAVAPAGTRICEDWTYQGKTIQQWIELCESSVCTGSKSQISSSGCIEAFDAFNNSEDSGFDQTPAPFDRPSVDDRGVVSGADPTQFTLAAGKYNPPGTVVIGKVCPARPSTR